MREQNCISRGQQHVRFEGSRSSPAPTSSSMATSGPSEGFTSVLKPALVNNNNNMDDCKQRDRAGRCETPSPSSRKPTKQIRFNLGSGNLSKDDSWLSPTPPPKEFKRMGTQRRTMLPRNERCLSAVVTEKDLRAALQFGKKALYKFVTSVIFHALNCTSGYYIHFFIFYYRRQYYTL